MVLVQGGQHRVIHRGKHRLLPLEFHLGLGGVDVHVHLAGAYRQVDDTAGEFPHHPLVFVGFLHRRHHHAAFYVPSVDEKVLITPGSPAAGGQGGEPLRAHPVAAALHGQEAQGDVPAHDGVDGAFQLPVAGGEQLLLPVPDEFHTDLRVGQGGALDHGEHSGALGGILLGEFQPGGGVVKQVPHRHSRALGTARLLLAHHHPRLHGEGSPQCLVLGAGEQLYPGDGGDRRQRLPPEAQGADGLQIPLAGDLGRGVAQEGGGGLVRRDAAAVVGDPDQRHAAVGDLHRHRPGPGVDGVFHQLLHHAGGALHHLPGGDEVRHMGV